GRQWACEAYGLRSRKSWRSRLQLRWPIGGPVLVDVVSARQELAMPPAVNLDQALSFRDVHDESRPRWQSRPTHRSCKGKPHSLRGYTRRLARVLRDPACRCSTT